MKPSEVIIERGWIQGSFETQRGVCVRGAVQIACHGADEKECDARCGRLTLQLTGVVGVPLAIGYNDAPGRTVEQVIALLREFEIEFESDAVQPAEPVTVA